MSRYIDADELERKYMSADYMDNDTAYDVIAELDTAPSIDIVRCKECRWGKPYSDKQLECDALGLGGLKFPNDFCNYGEREGE